LFLLVSVVDKSKDTGKKEFTIRPFYWFNLHVLIANVALFSVLALLGMIALNLSFLNPISQALGDFNLSDLLYSKLGTRANLIDTNIILVNIGHLNRSQIARQLEVIKEQDPKVVGFDGFFIQKRDPEMDSILREALQKPPGVVMACFLAGRNEESGIFDSLETSNPYFTGPAKAFVNLGGTDPLTSTVRTFSPSEIFHNDTLYALGVELVRRYCPEAAEKLFSRDNTREIINYKSNRNGFIAYDVDALFDTIQDFSVMKNKIVLMGYMGESFASPTDMEDIYYTPMNPEIAGRSRPDMYGVVIHANIASMILSSDYINKMPLWLTILISFVICYYFILLVSWVNARYNFFYKMHFNTFLFVFNILAIYLIFILYHYAHFSIHTGYLLAPVLLYPTFLNYFERIILILHRRYGLCSIFIPN
jgi:CHASE2 domain-containing sensor protein